MNERQAHDQRQPLLAAQRHATTDYSATNSPQASSPNTASPALDLEHGARTHYEPDIDSDDNEDPVKETSKWRAWYRSIFKFFQGLGKFFLILAVGTIILVVVLQYTLPRVDEYVPASHLFSSCFHSIGRSSLEQHGSDSDF